MEVVPTVEKLNSISRERLNFRRQPILCTYNFVQKPCTSEQFRWHIWPTFTLNYFMQFSHKRSLYIFYTIVQKSQKCQKTQIKVADTFLEY